ncbi:GAF domain-containing sensor histidine kinase [Falsiroseomonas sp. HC035]|uniref:GAF domain-containing sensor histidine kinase n=1 Tax=Falsiroseomonas sp. HC035 TaxID=3390999 RepID=UPI003D315DFD
MPETFSSDVALVGRIAAVPKILDVVCTATGMGLAAVARVTDSRWVTCAALDNLGLGLEPGRELRVETTLCHEIRQRSEPVVINHVAEDASYRDHHTPAIYGFQSYISVPILLPDGRFFGTLCAIDPKPRVLDTPATRGMFQLFAELIGIQIEAQERLVASEAEVDRQRAESRLREQFIAVLGHDLRNPLAAVDASMRMLHRAAPAAATRSLIEATQASVRRMSGLIGDVLDLARGRLAGGIPLARETGPVLEPALRQVVREIRQGHPGRVILSAFDLQEAVACDSGRIAQLCSNLLGNAVGHGAPDRPIGLAVSSRDGWFSLRVSNQGDPIPEATLGQLFQPFFRGAVRPGQQGLGLGLYISAEIARAHGGTLGVVSDAAETYFTFRMPTTRAPIAVG